MLGLIWKTVKLLCVDLSFSRYVEQLKLVLEIPSVDNLCLLLTMMFVKVQVPQSAYRVAANTKNAKEVGLKKKTT